MFFGRPVGVELLILWLFWQLLRYHSSVIYFRDSEKGHRIMEKVQTTGIKRYLPNIVSLFRIFGAIALPFMMWDSWGVTIRLPGLGEFASVPIIWIVFFTILVFSDKVDGTLARKLKVESELGALFDVIGDTLLLVIGVFCVILGFAKESFTSFQLWFNIIMVIIILSQKIIVFPVTKKYFGEPNALHSYPHKAFAAVAYVLVAWWAFTLALPMWSILLLLAMMTYAVVDEVVYLVRAETYSVDFKGHGFERYPLRKPKDKQPNDS